MKSLAKCLASFIAERADPLQKKLLELWKQWDEILGPMAEEIVPLGHKGESLTLGVYSSVALQEYRFFVDQILEPVNSFLGEKVFSNIQLELVNGRPPLNRLSLSRTISPPPLPVPDRIGHLDLPEESPVGRVYARYVAFHKARK